MKIADLLKPAAIQEDWGSSDWYPIMKSMKKYVDEKFDGKQTDEHLHRAAMEVVGFYMDQMGYDDEEDAADSAVRTFKARRKFPESGLAEERTNGMTIREIKAKIAELKKKGDDKDSLAQIAKLETQLTRINPKDELKEGMYVVKNKDGVEKRFKDHDSPEAKAWKASEKKKPAAKHEKFSQGYWEKMEDDGDSDFIAPWTKITNDNIDSAEVERAIKHEDAGKHEDWTIGKTGSKKIDGVTCATVTLRVLFSYSKDDDLGTGDEEVQDSQTMTFARSPKNPKKYVFAGY